MTGTRRLLLWLASLLAEAAVLVLLVYAGTLGVLAALFLHVVAAGVFGFSLLDRERRDLVDRGEWAWPLLGWTLSLVVFPLLGMLAVAAAYGLVRSGVWREGFAAGIEVSEETDAVGDVAARAREVEVSLLDEREIEPVVDVLQEDDPEAKRAAIEALTKGGGGAETVRLLRGLLYDPSPQARLFASLALSKLEDEIGQSILAAQRALQESPNSSEARERLAQLYLEYTTSGFLEGAARDYYLELAREAFEEALEASPGPDRLVVPLARTHLALGDIAYASVLLDELAQKRPDDPEVHLARMEVIYAFGDFRELSIYAERAARSADGGSDEQALIGWWATAREETEARDAPR